MAAALGTGPLADGCAAAVSSWAKRELPSTAPAAAGELPTLPSWRRGTAGAAPGVASSTDPGGCSVGRRSTACRGVAGSGAAALLPAPPAAKGPSSRARLACCTLGVPSCSAAGAAAGCRGEGTPAALRMRFPPCCCCCCCCGGGCACGSRGAAAGIAAARCAPSAGRGWARAASPAGAAPLPAPPAAGRTAADTASRPASVPSPNVKTSTPRTRPSFCRARLSVRATLPPAGTRQPPVAPAASASSKPSPGSATASACVCC